MSVFMKDDDLLWLYVTIVAIQSNADAFSAAPGQSGRLVFSITNPGVISSTRYGGSPAP